MISPGEVEAVRELKRGVQARVCLGSSVKHGSAVVVVETESPKVREALANLKRVIAEETRENLADILKDQAAWDAERSRAS